MGDKILDMLFHVRHLELVIILSKKWACLAED